MILSCDQPIYVTAGELEKNRIHSQIFRMIKKVVIFFMFVITSIHLYVRQVKFWPCS